MIREAIGDATLYLGDCRDILPTLGKVDAVVTSPPYGQQRDYGKKITDWRDLVCTAIRATPAHEQTQVLVNLGLIHREGHVIQYWDDLINDMKTDGWRLFGWYVWDKLDGPPGDWHGRLAPSHEFIFHFNRQARKANKFVPSKCAGQKLRGSDFRLADGSAPRRSGAGRPISAFKVQDSVIRTRREIRPGIDHPAVFPEQLPGNLISSFTSPNNIVLDPFMGAGTTGIACKGLGRRFIGIELEPKYFNIACDRIRKAYDQPDMLCAS